jgi:hypothetical protein
MRILNKTKDGGPESPVDAFSFVSSKVFSVLLYYVLIKVEGRTITPMPLTLGLGS